MAKLNPFNSITLRKEMAQLQGRVLSLESQTVVQQSEIEKSQKALLEKEAENQRLQAELELAKLKLLQMSSVLFGASSERELECVPLHQLPLFNYDIPEVPEASGEQDDELVRVNPFIRKKSKRFPRERDLKLPDHLPVVVEDVPAENCTCTNCGKLATRLIRHEKTRQLAYSGCPFYIQETRRPVLACVSCEGMGRITPLNVPLERSIFHESILAGMAAEKCGLGVPLTRQALRMQINEIQVSVESLYKAWIVGSSQLQPLAQAVRDSILEGVSIGDVTHVRGKVRDSDSMKESYKRCNLFGLMGVNKEVFYEYGETLFNGDFERVYQGVIFPFASDAAAGFKNLAKRLNVKQACCNGHARRKFKHAKNYNIKLSLEALSFYKELFLIESNIFSLSPEEKLVIRQVRSKPIMDALRIWCQHHYEKEPPKTPIAVACRYVRKNWTELTYFLKDGRVPFHTNDIERIFRGIANARKAFLHVSSLEGGKALAIYFTLVHSCQLINVDPFIYLADVFRRIGEHTNVNDLIPRNWKERFYEDARQRYAFRPFQGQIAPVPETILQSPYNVGVPNQLVLL